MSVFKTDWRPHAATLRINFLPARPGLEPELEESKSSVLPLDHRAMCNSIRARGIEPPFADRKSTVIAITPRSQNFSFFALNINYRDAGEEN